MTDNRMAAQHFPRDLVRPSSGFQELARSNDEDNEVEKSSQNVHRYIHQKKTGLKKVGSDICELL